MAEELKVLFVGLGSIGNRHLKNVTQLAHARGLQVRADALRSSTRPLEADIAALLHHEYYTAENLPEYDCIFISNPTNLHYKTILELQHKAPAFFIEKPLDYTFLTPQQLECINPGKIFYVACPLRHTKVYQALREIVAKLDKVYAVRAICSSYLPEWRTGADYRKLYSAKAENGGVKVDLIHDFDYLFELFGDPTQCRLVERKLSDLEIEASDFVHFAGDYGHMYLNLHLDYFGRIPRREVEIYSVDSVIRANFIDSSIQINSDVTHYNEERNEYCLREIQYFLDLCAHKEANINDLNKANHRLEIIWKSIV